MNKIKALLVTLVVGSSSVAMAAPRIISSRDATFVVRDRGPVYAQPVSQHPGRYQPRQPFYPGHRYEEQRTLTGSYTSAFGPVQLYQRGDRVTGTFTAGGGGTIEGRIIGNQIEFRWKNTAERGRGVWYMASPNRIDGTWGKNRSETDGGAWDLRRL